MGQQRIVGGAKLGQVEPAFGKSGGEQAGLFGKVAREAGGFAQEVVVELEALIGFGLFFGHSGDGGLGGSGCGGSSGFSGGSSGSERGKVGDAGAVAVIGNSLTATDVKRVEQLFGLRKLGLDLFDFRVKIGGKVERAGLAFFKRLQLFGIFKDVRGRVSQCAFLVEGVEVFKQFVQGGQQAVGKTSGSVLAVGF